MLEPENYNSPLILFYLLPPTVFDLLGVTLQNIGLVLTRDGGSFMVIRSSSMIWCALLSIPILGRYPKLYQILGMFVCAAGVFVKSSIMFPFIFANYKEYDYCQDGNNFTNVKISSEIGKEKLLQ